MEKQLGVTNDLGRSFTKGKNTSKMLYAVEDFATPKAKVNGYTMML
jgi:hypothetical protein